MAKVLSFAFIVLVLFSSCQKDPEPIDNLNSLPDSDSEFYLINNNVLMKWTTDGEEWTDIYKVFNRTRNTPNSAQFKTDGVRVYAYSNGTLYDAEKGAYYNVLDLAFTGNNSAQLAVTSEASYIWNPGLNLIRVVAHNAVTFNTFFTESTGIESSEFSEFHANSNVVFAYEPDADNRVLFSSDQGNTWSLNVANLSGASGDAFMNEVESWGENFYGTVNGSEAGKVYKSNNATSWSEVPFTYNATASGGDTVVRNSVYNVFASGTYVNFVLFEEIIVNDGTGETITPRFILMEAPNGNSFTGTDLDGSIWNSQNSGGNTTIPRIYKIGDSYVTEFFSQEKGNASIHYSSDLINWTVIDGTEMYLSNVYQLVKAQTVR